MLYISSSQITGAGLGLFTDSDIPKDTLIVEYTGEIIDWKEYEKRFDAGHGGYLFSIRRNKNIDAFNVPSALARYANDARGKARNKRLRNNSFYDIVKGRAYIKASRKIEAHSEIFVWYGNDYWDYLEGNKDISKVKF